MTDKIFADNRIILVEIDQTLDKYDSRKDRNRAFAVGIRVATSFLGAAVAVLLAWKYEGKSVEWMTNFALICGALISVMNSIDTFFSFSSRWTHYKGICTQLIFLKKDAENELLMDTDKIGFYQSKLNDIIIEARKGEIEFHAQRK